MVEIAALQLYAGVCVENNYYIITSFMITQLRPQNVWVFGFRIVWVMGYERVMGYHLQTNLVYQKLYGL
jgi:hypothetical protein